MDVSSFHVLMSMLYNSSFVQLSIPNVAVTTGITKLLWDITLFYRMIQMTKISLVTLNILNTL